MRLTAPLFLEGCQDSGIGDDRDSVTVVACFTGLEDKGEAQGLRV